MTTDEHSGDWVPDACSLPTADQPLRRAEFDDLFARDVLEMTMPSPQRVDLELRADPEVAARAAALAVKETGCCSFFTFTLDIGDGRLSLCVEASAAHGDVVAALATRAEAQMRERAS